MKYQDMITFDHFLHSIWSSNSGHEQEKVGNFDNFYGGIMNIFSGRAGEPEPVGAGCFWLLGAGAGAV